MLYDTSEVLKTYKRYEELCEKFGQSPIPRKDICDATWREHYKRLVLENLGESLQNLSNAKKEEKEIDLSRPRHLMTSMAVVGQKKEIAVLVYGQEKGSLKCHTIYGDIFKFDLREPTLRELMFVHNASKLMGLTEADREFLKELEEKEKEKGEVGNV